MEEDYEINFTKNEFLESAARCACNEARKWREIALGVLDENYYTPQAYVMLLLSSELFLKALLMILDINIMSKKIKLNKHDLFKLYQLLPDDNLIGSMITNVYYNLKESNKKEKDFKKVKEYFEKNLKKCAHGFVYYRYLYEKVLKKKTVYIPIDFIHVLNNVLNAECNTFRDEKDDEEDYKFSYHHVERGWIDSIE